MQKKITIEVTANITGNYNLAAESLAEHITKWGMSSACIRDDESFKITVKSAKVV